MYDKQHRPSENEISRDESCYIYIPVKFSNIFLYLKTLNIFRKDIKVFVSN